MGPDSPKPSPVHQIGATPLGEPNAVVASKLRVRLDRTFSSLRYPNYRLWFAGQLASLLGTWMQMSAQGFLVFSLTRSPAYLGYVGLAAGVPILLFMLLGGVVSDRIARRKILVITQTSMMLLAFILAGLTFSQVVRPWHIVALAFCLGMATAFDAPARQAFVVEMVEREDLSNAIALNASMINLAKAVGPAVGGITYAYFGPAWCFSINGISFLVVIAALLRMKLPLLATRREPSSPFRDLGDGMRYVASTKIVLTLILIGGVTALIGEAHVTLFPAWAVVVLGGDSMTNGWLQSARGLGALVGALMIASQGQFRFKGRLLTLGTFVLPASVILFSFARWLPLSLLLLVGVGWGWVVVFNMLNSLVQHAVQDSMRGRVMGLYVLSHQGLTPIGSLIAGAAGSWVGEATTLRVSGILLLLSAVLILLRSPQLRGLE